MQHSLKLFILLGLVGSLSACGLPRASDINPPPEPEDTSSLDDPLPPLIIPAPQQQPNAAEGLESEAVESDRLESAAIETTPEEPASPEPETPAAPEGDLDTIEQSEQRAP